MKKITLLLSLLITSIGFSQDLVLGFESGESGGINGGPFGNMTSATVVTGTGSNTSQVLEIVANPSGEIWQGINLNLTTNVELTAATTRTMTMDVLSSTPIYFLAKVNGGVSGAPESAASVFHNGDGTWQTVSFTFDTSLDGKGLAEGTYASFVIHAYWANGATVFGDVSADTRTFYVDNLMGPESTATEPAPTTAPPTPTHLASDVVSLYSDAYTDVSSNMTPGWGEVVTVEEHASNNVVKTTNFLPFALSSTIDLTTYDNMHVDIWISELPAAGAGLLIKLLDAANGPHEGNYIEPNTNITVGSWNSFNIPISSFTQAQGTWDATAQSMVNQVLVDIVDDATIYIDNVYFYKEAAASVDKFDINQVSLYPNPANNILSLGTSLTVDKVEVFSVLGRKINNVAFNNNQVDVSNLASGIYLLRIHSEGKTGTKKFIKQ